MTVYEAMVKAQSSRCNVIKDYMQMVDKYPGDRWAMELYQESIDRAYLLGIAIDNLRCDIATIEV